ncbi:MAG: TIM barrel protein, partial [Rhodobacteraceae bacterium]|nr:TIM barrel protein [Paracoccaceae bacterium]
MPLPLLGLALSYAHYAPLEAWICEEGRAIEIQDFVYTSVIRGDVSDMVARWKAALGAHHGPRGIHGPFFGLDLANPDPDLRAIIQTRFLKGLEVAEALAATHMVIHSPFSYWHVLNAANYADIQPSMFDDCASCLAPVLARAADIGCTLMLENIDDTNPATRVDLVRAIGHPNLRVSLD